MPQPRSRTIDVLVDHELAGRMQLEIDERSPLEFVSFTYVPEWLANPDAFEISPELPLVRGPQQPTLGRELFGAFQDAAPDAWGKKLLQHEIAQVSKAGHWGARGFREPSLLLRVRDETRQGALRFREDGVFLSEKGKGAGIKDLSQLARAAQIFAETGEVDEEDSLLIGAGSSPGGAHPKAWVQDDDGVMWLAKFPMSSDLWNVQLWEMVAINLQRQCGIRVQESRLLSLTSWSQIFLTRRFDRDGQRRIPYMSVRTALQLDPHAHPSYALLAREIAAISSQPMLDANEMFSRAAFNAMTANTDDHMRNHGLLRTAKGWSLSPAFDVNPNPTVVSAVPLVPGGDVYDRNVLELLDRCEDFRLDRPAAVRRLKQVAEAVSHWRREALALGAEPDSLGSKVRAFEGPNLGRVSALPEPTDARGAGDAAPRPRLTGRIWVPDHVRGGKPVRGHYRNERQPRTR